LVQGWLQKYPEKKQIILVLASPVCEVGRDHDYDWMIIEPSSMRSIIQASGRARRHRTEPYFHPNVFIMETNIRHFRHPQQACFSRPGFEATGFEFKQNRHFLRGIDDKKNAGLMDLKHFKQLDSIARLIQPPANYLKQFYEKSGYPRLADLEHDRMHHILLGHGICPDMRSTDMSPIKFPAYSFWNTPIHYTGILQTLSRFRQSQAEFFTALRAEEQELPLKLYQYNEKTGTWLLVESLVRRIELANNPQIHCWPNQKPEIALEKYLDATSVERNWSENCSRYLSLNLPKLADQKKWLYHDWLGFVRE